MKIAVKILSRPIWITITLAAFPLWINAANTFVIDSPKNKVINYQKNYYIQSSHFKKKIDESWDKQEISTSKKWVGYSSNLKSKQVINFEKNSISLETIAVDRFSAREQLPKLLKNLLTKNIDDVISNNPIDPKRSLSKATQKQNKKINLLAYITQKEKLELEKTLENTPLVEVQYKDHTIYKAKLQLPKNHIIRKAKQYKKYVKKYSQKYKIDPGLIYAVIHSESYFNPVARSKAPAYGLMQIVPQTAGIDAYKFIYKKKRIPSSAYLYNPNNNIRLGSAYLHILYFIYFKKITDEKSRLYCTIAAYNTGAGNVAKSFATGKGKLKNAIKIINKLEPEIVYKKLLKDLPFLETKRYLKKVADNHQVYKHLLKNELAL